MITFYSANNSDFIDHVIKLIEGFCGMDIFKTVSDPKTDNVDIYYGNNPTYPFNLRIPFKKSYSKNQIAILSKDILDHDKPMDFHEFPFDLFSAIRFWLCDYGNNNAPENAYDKHERLLGKHNA